MANTENGNNGAPQVTRVELDIRNEGVFGGHRWRYRLSSGPRDEEHEMEEMSRPLSLFECALRGGLDVMVRIGDGRSVCIEAPRVPLVLGINRWIRRWRVNGWLTYEGDPVRHRKLWELLWHMSNERHVEWVCATSVKRQLFLSPVLIVAGQTRPFPHIQGVGTRRLTESRRLI